jgi:hypothetical protein
MVGSDALNVLGKLRRKSVPVQLDTRVVSCTILAYVELKSYVRSASQSVGTLSDHRFLICLKSKSDKNSFRQYFNIRKKEKNQQLAVKPQLRNIKTSHKKPNHQVF